MAVKSIKCAFQGNIELIARWLLTALEESGLHFERPGVGTVQVYDANDVRHVGRMDVLPLLLLDPTINIQMWMDECTDVPIFFKNSMGAVIAVLYLDGKSEEQRDTLMASMTTIWRRACRDRIAIAMVMDPDGAAEDSFWEKELSLLVDRMRNQAVGYALPALGQSAFFRADTSTIMIAVRGWGIVSDPPLS